MATAIRVSDTLAQKARSRAKVQHRSLAGQIEFWATIGEIAEANPDLPFSLLQDILTGLQEAGEGQVTPYVFGEGQ